VFIASVQYPSIGMHKWTSFSSITIIVDVSTREDAIKEIYQILPEKDPEVQKALYEQDCYNDGEYFQIRLHEVPQGQKIVRIYEPNTGFNLPYETLRL